MQKKIIQLKECEKVGLKIPEYRGGVFFSGNHDDSYHVIRRIFSKFLRLTGMIKEQQFGIERSVGECAGGVLEGDRFTVTYDNEGGNPEKFILWKKDLFALRKFRIMQFNREFPYRKLRAEKEFYLNYLDASIIGSSQGDNRNFVLTSSNTPLASHKPWVLSGFRIIQTLYSYDFNILDDDFVERITSAEEYEAEAAAKIELERILGREIILDDEN